MDKPRGRKPRRMRQRLSKARQLWRLRAQQVIGSAFGRMSIGLNRAGCISGSGHGPCAGRVIDGCYCRWTRFVARRHKFTPHQLAMNKVRCLVVSDLRANVHDGGARIEARSRTRISTTSKGRPQCRQTNAGARVAGSPVCTSTLTCSAARAIPRQSRRLPLASSP